MAARPRLLIVVNDAPFFLSHRLPIALGAAAAGYEVHVATPDAQVTPDITAHGLAFHPLPLARGSTSPRTEGAAVAALVALYRRLAPDVVHHVTAKPILYGGIAARLARVPAVVHAVSGLGHVFISDAPRARLLRHAIRATYAVVTAHPNCAVVFQNEDDRQVFGSAIRTPHVVTIPGSGVDLTVFRPTPLPDEPTIILPARMLWDKGVGDLVEAARILAGAGVRAKVVLVGGVDPDNPAAIPRATLEAWVSRGIVLWWGSRTDMPDVLAQASVVCLPSYREGMPKSLLEAIAAGRPVVTTDVPGCRDVVAGGEHGVLVPARNPSELARVLGELLVDRPRLERMATAAAAVAPRFAIETVVARTLAVYADLRARAGR
jgi:glycosyltransferase involved in cell wall biosynthesis